MGQRQEVYQHKYDKSWLSRLVTGFTERTAITPRSNESKNPEVFYLADLNRLQPNNFIMGKYPASEKDCRMAGAKGTGLRASESAPDRPHMTFLT